MTRLFWKSYLVVRSTGCTHYKTGGQLNANGLGLLRVRRDGRTTGFSRGERLGIFLRGIEQRQQQFQSLFPHLEVGLPDRGKRWVNMRGGYVVIEADQRHIAWNRQAELIGSSQHAKRH